MKNSKIVRGHPTYIYRRSQYIEMPEGCIIKKVKYDTETNRSIVICGKPSIIVELLCSAIMLLCVSLSMYFNTANNYLVRYNSLANYYNGMLYLNLYNDNSNSSDVDISVLDGDLLVSKVTLSPGEYCISIPIDSPKGSYKLRMEADGIIGRVTDTCGVTVLERGIKDE